MSLSQQSTNVRQIKAAIADQASKGRRSVRIAQGRVMNVRTVKGQLQARLLSSGEWINVESVTLE